MYNPDVLVGLLQEWQKLSIEIKPKTPEAATKLLGLISDTGTIIHKWDNQDFTPTYMMLLEYSDGDVQLAKSADNELVPVVAREGSQELLERMGDQFLADGYIIGYQIVMTVSPPKKVY